MQAGPNHRALELWHQAMLAGVRCDDPDLTMRQFSVLLSVYLTPPPHTVRGLAAELGVTKPVITRALDTMGEMGLLKRKKDEKDKRSVLVQRTVRGAVYLNDLSQRITKAEQSLDMIKANQGE